MNENKLRAAIAQNPVLVLLLGACPALAATTAVLPALTLGVTALAVMLLASLFSSLINEQMIAKGKSVGADAQFSKPQIKDLIDYLIKLLS